MCEQGDNRIAKDIFKVIHCIRFVFCFGGRSSLEKFFTLCVIPSLSWERRDRREDIMDDKRQG